MSDKRTTPEAPEAAPQSESQATPQPARRKRRAAATIDLTATEMPPLSDAPPVDEPARAPPPQPGEPVAARTGGGIFALLVAGLAGGAIVVLAALGFWLSGLLPARQAGPADVDAQVAALQAQMRDLTNRPPAAPDKALLDALAQRVGRIEDTISKLPAGDAGVAAKLAAADSAMKSLGVALAALNRRTDDVAVNAGVARERADAAAQAVAGLQGSVQEAAKASAAGISPADFQSLQDRIAALEIATKAARAEIAGIAGKTSGSDNAARLALSAEVLRDAVVIGAPYADELAAVKQLAGDDKTLAALAPYAASGVPSAQALAQQLGALLPALLRSSGAQAPQGGFLERLQANAGRLVRIRPVDAPPGDDPSAVMARIEIAAAKADIAAAVSDIGKLPDAARQQAAGWVGQATARQNALAAARQYAAATARALGSK